MTNTFLRLILLASLWLAVVGTHAQRPYFQQEVHYRISVALNDSLHTLQGYWAMHYINHSPDTLREMWLHLWPNAYSSKNTALARQLLRNRNTQLHFAPDSALGGFSELDFRLNGTPAPLVSNPQHPDIARLALIQPLLPGDTLLVETPFVLRIPASFSRLGHVRQSYQITQWYPKPAVYDNKGWHPMPYLDMGEFYSEFGSFDVTITLPQNYIVAATGVLQTESERVFLEEKIAQSSTLLAQWPSQTEPAPFPPSAPDMKTIRFVADRVHDFAWFADKRFLVQRATAALDSGRNIDTWAFFTPYQAHLWKHGAQYVARAVAFYAAQVGEYPWPHATAVEGALGAGGGMEYPMITIIGAVDDAEDLDMLIAHEVGHNWFYGILATNERDHAWMDEGMNSFYENAYRRAFYGHDEDGLELPAFLRKASPMSISEAGWLLQARRRMDQPCDTPAEQMSALNYLLGAYSRPAALLRLLEMVVGADTFSRAMQAYYQQWQFRHPYPEDFRAVMERETGRSLDWFFDGMLQSNQRLDYSLRKSQPATNGRQVWIQNRGDIAAPFQLSAIRNDSIVWSQWHEGFHGRKVLDIPAGKYDRLTLDADRLSPELNRRNNHLRLSGSLPRMEPLQIRLLPGLENDQHTTLYATPIVAGNAYDGLMAGAALYNSTLPERSVEWAIAPMFAIRSKSLTGLGQIQWHGYPAGKFVHGIHAGVQVRSFHFFRQEQLNYDLRYTRLMPFVKLELYQSPAATLYRQIQWRSIWLQRQTPIFAPGGLLQALRPDRTWIHEWSYRAEQRRVLHPHSLWIALEHQNKAELPVDVRYWKASLEWQGAHTFEPGRHLRLRFFAGGFLSNIRRNRGAIFPEAFNLAAQGFNDYRFDDFYFGRTDSRGIWSQQIHLREGGMKALTGQGFSLGRSNNFIVALNLSADLPSRFWLPIKPWFDIGYFDNAMPTGANDTFADQLLWSGGIALEAFDRIVGVYLPLINSRNLQNRLAERGGLLQRIAFSIDLNRLNPYELAKRAVY